MKRHLCFAVLLLLVVVPGQSLAKEIEKGDQEVAVSFSYVDADDVDGFWFTVANYGYYVQPSHYLNGNVVLAGSDSDVSGSYGFRYDYHFNPASNAIGYAGSSVGFTSGDFSSGISYSVQVGLKVAVREAMFVKLEAAQLFADDDDVLSLFAGLGLRF